MITLTHFELSIYLFSISNNICQEEPVSSNQSVWFCQNEYVLKNTLIIRL